MASIPETEARAVEPVRRRIWLWLAAGLILSAVVARDGVSLMTSFWFSLAEYSHGVLIPFISAFLVWRNRENLGDLRGSWLGPVVVIVGLIVWLLGVLSTITALSQYALVVMIYGVVLTLVGPSVFSRLWAPMLMLLLMVPLPHFFYANLSSQLQLISSALGVWLMRLCGISVYLSGNVIDLGHFQMQVVEACDGLRYLFPLMTLGFIVAYFFRAPLWQRVIVFLSSVPITIVMNSVRIAMIGVLADFGNTSLAEGLLHEFQGWVIFMLSGALLLVEARLLAGLGGASWRDVLAFDAPPPSAPTRRREARAVPASLVATTAVLAIAAATSYMLPQRVEARPQRSWFVDFPTTLDGWKGRQGKIEAMYLDVLQVDDYLMEDFTNGTDFVNLYAAYYASQRQGESVHSPRSCIPGGGWRMTSFGQVTVPTGSGEGLPVNRAIIELGDQRQLVYYWFKQRERFLTNEYSVKWYIFTDALTRQRTDGALVRLVTPLHPGEDAAAADARLQSFATTVQREMPPFLPD